MKDAIYQFVFSAATIGLVVGFFAWLWRRLARQRSFHVVEKGKVRVRLPDSLGRPALGRAKELAQLEGALAEGSPLVIVGTAGVGKTTMGEALADRIRRWERRLVWIECKPSTDLEAFLYFLSLHMKDRYGDDRLQKAFEKTQVHDARQWIDLLTDCLHGDRYVFFWDDLYLVQDEIVTSILLPSLLACADVVIMTRENTPELQTALQSVAKPFFLPLTGLQDGDAVALLRDRGLVDEPQDLLQQLARKFAGHPKALEVCAGLIRDEIRGLSLEQLLSQSLLSQDPSQKLIEMLEKSDQRLSRHERTMMVACATFYEPFAREELFAVYDPGRSAVLLARLVRRSLVDEGQDNLYSLHPLVREYYQMCSKLMLPTRWGTLRVPKILARPLFGSFLLWRRSDHYFHYRAARYYQQHLEDTSEGGSLIVQHLKAAHRWRQATEAEGIILKIQKHPVAVAGDLCFLLFAVVCVWLAAYVGLPLLARTGWSWLIWLDMHKLPFAVLVTCVGTLYGLFWARTRLLISRLSVTQKGSLTISDSLWALPRLRKPRRLVFGPGRWLWWFDRPFIDSNTLTVERTWPVFERMGLGYITAHLNGSGVAQRALRFGPIAEPKRRVAEIYQALGTGLSSPPSVE